MNSIYSDIAKCKICPDYKPFHFEMGRQKIMLLSNTPSYAALHRPLYFIQLFRRMCLALFGDVAPSENFIREFYDPTGNIYWTHYQKCFRHDGEDGPSKCEPLLAREINALDPEIIIILGNETLSRLYQDALKPGILHQELPSDRHPYIKTRKNGKPRTVFITDFPSRRVANDYLEIRKAIKPYIGWVKVECENLDFSSVNFMDLEYASILSLNEIEQSGTIRINNFEREWVAGIILPNIRAYNLMLQVFIFIESNIKILLEGKLGAYEDIEKKWFSPFRYLVDSKLGAGPGTYEQKQAIRTLMSEIDSLQALRNLVAHKSGVISDRDEDRNLKNIEKLKRLKGVYIYGGNSIFISGEGVASILDICNRFRTVYIKNFIQ